MVSKGVVGDLVGGAAALSSSFHYTVQIQNEILWQICSFESETSPWEKISTISLFLIIFLFLWGFFLFFLFFFFGGLFFFYKGGGAVFMVFGATTVLLEGFINFLQFFFCDEDQKKGRQGQWLESWLWSSF
jgi:hypothetical protein